MHTWATERRAYLNEPENVMVSGEQSSFKLQYVVGLAEFYLQEPETQHTQV